MTIKRIDELNRLSLTSATPDIESLIVPLKKDESADQANGLPVAQIIIVDFDPEVAYIVGRRLQYGSALYKVTTETTAGQTPASNPEKFELLGSSFAAGVYLLKADGGFVLFEGSTPVQDAITARETGDVLYLNNYNGTTNPETLIVTGALNIFSINSTIYSAAATSAPLITHSGSPFTITCQGVLNLVRQGGDQTTNNPIRITDGSSTFKMYGTLIITNNSGTPISIQSNAATFYVTDLNCGAVSLAGGNFKANTINGSIGAITTSGSASVNVVGVIAGALTLNNTTGSAFIDSTGNTSIAITTGNSFNGLAVVRGVAYGSGGSDVTGGSFGGVLYLYGSFDAISWAAGSLFVDGFINSLTVTGGRVEAICEFTPAITQSGGNITLTGTLRLPGSILISLSGTAVFKATGMSTTYDSLSSGALNITGGASVELIDCQIRNLSGPAIKVTTGGSLYITIRNTKLLAAGGQDSIDTNAAVNVYNYNSYANRAADVNVTFLVNTSLTVSTNVLPSTE